MKSVNQQETRTECKLNEDDSTGNGNGNVNGDSDNRSIGNATASTAAPIPNHKYEFNSSNLWRFVTCFSCAYVAWDFRSFIVKCQHVRSSTHLKSSGTQPLNKPPQHITLRCVRSTAKYLWWLLYYVPMRLKIIDNLCEFQPRWNCECAPARPYSVRFYSVHLP